ncbi:phage tail tape measure protein [Streptomyces sp. 5-8]|uniref:Phage tail tape measure protein n=1 Tax=Streptomyces musisoli TaxID=2802280 RepID=A0ABS1P7D5_9ACTN|nr:phage tail tape measure protein [Streptomyces musisoli]MBL1107980.1 phage tail tape measure protein [Streptomyces musisoli]
MALTVGELNAVLSVDDRAVDPALRRAEQALRQAGQQMAGDAEDAGQQIGQGLVRGADGQWRNMRGELVDEVTAAAAEAEAEAHRAGRQVGRRFEDGVQPGARQAGDDLADGVRRGADDAADAANDAGDQAGEGFFGRMRTRTSEGVANIGANLREGLGAKFGLAALGAAAGATLMAGISQAMDEERITGRLAAQLGKTPAEARRYGHIAGQLYADAVTEDFEGAAEAISVTMRAGLLPPAATDRQIRQLATGVSDLASTFELDLGQTANAVGQTIKTGLAKDGVAAIDAFTRGLQTMGPRADDIADTFNEYSVIFQRLGLNVQQATGLMSQGLKAGARDTDVVADALKEFTIEGVQGSSKIVSGFKHIGLNSGQMVKMISKGGPEATKALQMTLDKLRAMEDPVKRDAAATELFGTKSEDTQRALLALDPAKAVDALGQVGGAADEMGDALRDNASTKLEQAKRSMQQGLVGLLGGGLVQLDKFKGALGHIWDEAGKGSEGTAERISAFIGLIGQQLWAKIQELGPQAIQALSGLGQQAADYVMANPGAVFKITAIAGGLMLAIAMLPALVGGAVLAAAGTIIYGFASALISATQENVPRWWASFTGWVNEKAGQAGAVLTSLGSAIGAWFSGLWSRYVSGPVERQWAAFTGSVRALPGRATAALGGLGGALARSASSAWQRFKSAAAAEGVKFLAWVQGLPGRTTAAIGDMSRLLVSKGVAVVQGLWSGIKSMGSWIKEKLISWAKSMIPGPIAKALGIASPSKVTTEQGRWIARGLIEGLTGSSKQVKAASGRLADIIADSLKRGSKRTRALGTLSAGTKQLLTLARSEEKVAARLKVAQKNLSDQIAARNKLAADVRTGVLNSGAITGQTGSQSPQAILARLQQDRKAAELFAKNIVALKKKGVRSDLLAQIAQAGVEQGGAVAASLASATPAQIKAINAEQARLAKAAGKAGNSAADAMYGAGIRAGQGIVDGLKKQQRSIEQQMLTIAKAMSKSIRRALGIKSPSRVMARVGAYTAEGLRRGIESGRKAVSRSMASLVDTPTPRQFAAPGAAAAQGRRVVNNTTQNTYNLQHRSMTIRDLETLQRRQDALARVGRPR